MKKPLRAIIQGTGLAVPSEVLDNEYFARYLDTSDEWITTRSGIKQRYRARDGETTGTMAKEASEKALKDAGLSATDLDMIILATVTPDTIVPPGASWLQAALNAREIPAMDLNAACAGMVYAMVQAAICIDSGHYNNILVIGSETLTRIVNFEDRSTCVLFGDGAAAAVMTRTDDPKRGLIYHQLGTDGTGAGHIQVPAGGSRLPASAMTVAEKLHTMHMKGREVYKFAVKKFNFLVEETLEQTGIAADDLELIIPHQSNLRIITSVQNKLGLPKEKFLVNIDRYGNTSSASVGLALAEARQSGRIKEGDLVMFIAFGAGLTWGVLLYRM